MLPSPDDKIIRIVHCLCEQYFFFLVKKRAFLSTLLAEADFDLLIVLYIKSRTMYSLLISVLLTFF